MFKLALVCGGSSNERGISLNSVRSVFDNIFDKNIDITIIYFDKNLQPYEIPEAFLYSNTPSDFDFKLDFEARNVSKLTLEEFISKMKNVDLVFPIIHGYFGEDGKIQKIFEDNGIAYVGSSSKTCWKVYNKLRSKKFLRRNNFFQTKHIGITKQEFLSKNLAKIKDFLGKNNLKKVVVKPAESGSSFYIYPCENFEKIKIALEEIFGSYFKEAMIEEFCEGSEFTVFVIQHKNRPVSFIPLEVEVEGIFTYGKKYTPSHDTHYYCPPRFSKDVTKKIMQQAEKLFQDCGAVDFMRIDGWYLTSGEICFTDYNPISGMEQNSFLFQAASRIGLSHRKILEYIIANACARYKIEFPERRILKQSDKQRVNVLFGGVTSERDVSVMSGTNVWLKLMQSDKYDSFPYFLESSDTVWSIPYSIALNHNTAEISRQCNLGTSYISDLNFFGVDIRKRLEILEDTQSIEKILKLPKKMTLDEFIKESKNQNAYVFLGVHGGIGENGQIQKKLENLGLSYNGSDSKVSAICMDKFETGKVVNRLNENNLRSVQKMNFKLSDFINFNEHDFENYWSNALKKIYAGSNDKNSSLVVKPRCDGSSSGVLRLNSSSDFKNYIDILTDPAGAKCLNISNFQIPQDKTQEFLLEEFIETDKIFIREKKLVCEHVSNWIELTVGVIEKDGKYHAFQPSVTVADGDILTLEEKFQGGTGVNITPPDEPIISNSSIAVKKIQEKIELVSRALGIKNYARIDIFYNNQTNEVIIIEANTLPALTPSTVIFQQAVKENLSPKGFLEKIIDNSMKAKI